MPKNKTARVRPKSGRSGWKEDSLRHSLAKRFGHAPKSKETYWRGALQNKTWEDDPKLPTKKTRKKEFGDAINLRNKINKTLIESGDTQNRKKYSEPEILTIVVLQSKIDFFTEVLPASTKWKAIGTFKGFADEQNVVMQIQYYDDKKGKTGKQLIHNFNQLNEKILGEQLLFSYTTPVSETSLS